jgi:hypothetical protein
MSGRRHLSPSALLGLLLLSLAGAVPATARPLSLSVTPELATWQEAVTIHVEGTSASACGASAVSLTTPQVVPDPGRLVLELHEICSASGPPLQQPFAFDRILTRLRPDDYAILLSDPEGTVHQASLRVLDAGAHTLAVDPGANDGAPTMFRVRGFGCPTLSPPSVSGSVITLSLDTNCYGSFPTREAELFELHPTVGPLAPGRYEVRLIDTNVSNPSLVRAHVTVARAGSCVPSPSTLCLQDRRFEVTASWAAPGFHPPSGTAGATPIPGNDGSGALWFFAPDNLELTIKLLDGCAVTGGWWAFIASGSDVSYEVRVRDTRAGTTRVYTHDAGSVPPLVTDLHASSDCSP